MVKNFSNISMSILVMLTFSNCIAQQIDKAKIGQRNDLIKTSNKILVSKEKVFGVTDSVSLKFKKIDSNAVEIRASAPLTDSANCFCPAWYSTPVSGMRFFGKVLDEPGLCEGNEAINGQGCGFYIISGDTLAAKFKLYGYEAYSGLIDKFDPTKYYLQCTQLSIPDSTGDVHSYTGEFPIYEIDSTHAAFDISFIIDKKCATGTLKDKKELFQKNGLSIRVAIDATKPFPVATKVK